MLDFEDIEKRIHDFTQSLPCQSGIPFPPVAVNGMNLEYANMLQDAYSSSADSELQAITQYIFHSKTIAIKPIANALMCIALVEMHHLDVIGELITKLGGNPLYVNSNRNFWSTGNMAYVDSSLVRNANSDNDENKTMIRKKLEKDILGEINAINNYNNLLQNIDDEHIKKILLKIVSDEHLHIKIFESLIEKYL